MKNQYAILKSDGTYLSHWGSGGIRTYTSVINAERAVDNHWKNVKENGYSIVELSPVIVKTISSIDKT